MISLMSFLGACVSTPPPASPSQALAFPSPLDGPGLPELEETQHKAVARGWAELEAGRPDLAERAVAKAAVTPAGRLLSLQISLLRGDTKIEPGLVDLTRENPTYAAPWLTLSVEAEREDNENTALDSARTGARLWPAQRWTDRVQQLETRWIDDRVRRAKSALGEEQAEQALEIVDRALDLAPDSREGLLTRTHALIFLGRIDEAERVLSRLPADVEATLISAEIAERRRDWLGAMDRYSALPANYPQRAAALQRVQLRWRLSQLPGYAQQALASQELTRGELAILVVSLVPQVRTFGSGEVPLLTDIVELPYQREILTAVSSGLLSADTLEHRFHPQRSSTVEEARAAVEGLASLLDIPAPTWCAPDLVVQSPCTSVSQPVTGRALTEVVLRVVQGEVQ